MGNNASTVQNTQIAPKVGIALAERKILVRPGIQR
jgi:hypothetical protein